MPVGAIIQVLIALIPMGVEIVTRLFSSPSPPSTSLAIHTSAPQSRQDHLMPTRKSSKGLYDADDTTSWNPIYTILLTLGTVLVLAIIFYILSQRQIKRQERRRRTEQQGATPDSPSSPQTQIDDRPLTLPIIVSPGKTLTI